VHLDAGAGTFGQRVGELFADCVRPVNVALECDGLLRSANGNEHGGKNSVAIQQGFETVALQNGRPEQYPHRARKGRIGSRVAALDALLNFLLACGEVQRQDARKQRRRDSNDQHQHGGTFPSFHDCRLREFGTWHARIDTPQVATTPHSVS
jgi:hypothetical protein